MEKNTQSSRRLPLSAAALLLALATALFLPASVHSPQQTSTDIDATSFARGLEACRSLSAPNRTESSRPRTRNPRVGVDGAAPPPAVLIANASLWDGDGTLTRSVDILLRDGIVVSVTPHASVRQDSDTRVINVNGRFVTPGIVDMHSHVGLDSWPHLNGNSDINEESPSRLTPQLKSLDAFNPWDVGIRVINSGGVTTSLVLPGSRNLMGGEAFAFKLRHAVSNRSEHMLLNAGMSSKDGHKWRWMKMACGENPKNVDPDVAMGPIYPATRLGEAYLFREHLATAQRLKNEQDSWCALANTAVTKSGLNNAHTDMKSHYPTNIAFESLIALLRGQVILNVHCYETYDLEMIVRLAKEFGIRVSAFHHALEAWQVADLLSSEDIAAVIFPDHWGYKREAYDTSVHAPSILSDTGVPVVFKSDHPVINAQQLIFEAAKSHHYGFPASRAIQAITSAPAERMGQSHRIGYVRDGYDADVVIWDRYPLEIGAHPLQVYVDGYVTYEHPSNDISDTERDDTTVSTVVPEPISKIQFPDNPQKSRSLAPWTCDIPSGPNTTYTLYNIGHIVTPDTQYPLSSSTSMVIQNGIIKCIGACEHQGQAIDVSGFWITPGLVSSIVSLGLDEISQESVTKTGRLDLDANDGHAPDVPPVKDSLRLGRSESKMLDIAFKAGVTTSVSAFGFSGPVGGDLVAFKTSGEDVIHDVIPQSKPWRLFRVGLDANTGQKGPFASYGGHLAIVRDFIKRNPDTRVAVDVSSASNIRRLSTVLRKGDVMYGATESWVHANHLSDAGITVLFRPTRCTPNTWDKRACRVSFTVPSSYSILKSNNTRVGVTVSEDNFVRNLIWESGWTVSDATTKPIADHEFAREVVGLASWHIADTFGIPNRTRIAVGVEANLVVFDGVPGTLSASIRAVIDGPVVECNPVQP